MPLSSYATKINDIHIPNTNSLLIHSLQDRQQYHDPDGEAARLGINSALWPLFGLLWPSAVHLAGQLALRPVNDDERILEIGCGLALASIVAHRRGAKITASDHHPLAPLFLLENLRLNYLPETLRYRHGQWGVKSLPTADRAILTERYDLIIGSDLLYERDAPRAVAEFINRHAMQRAEVWIVNADRGYRPAFNRHMATHDFTLHTEIRLTKLPVSHVQAAYKGRLLRYQRI